MGIKDVISRFRRSDAGPAASSVDVNEPEDVRGEGPATLADRVEPGGQGSPGTNQAKTEPMVATPGHPDPTAPIEPPKLDDMTVGADDPQQPSPHVPGATTPPVGTQPTNMGGPGTVPADDRPVPDLVSSRGRDLGPDQPRQDTMGVAHRVPGLDGSTPPGEAIETDVEAGAARMQGQTPDASAPVLEESAGTGGVSVPSAQASEGTSEELTAVQGVRLPDAEEAERGERPQP